MHSLCVDTFLLQDAQILDAHLKSFWDLESFGISQSERTVLDEFQDEISFTGGRYEVALPWKDPHPPLLDNHQLNLKRLQGLLRRLRHDYKVLLEYDCIIKEQERLRIVEKVELGGEPPPGDKIQYLPHHAVVRRDKETTKVLGVRWNHAADQLVRDLEEIASAAVILDTTKRAIVRVRSRMRTCEFG
jgi:hypothetical protein